MLMGPPDEWAAAWQLLKIPHWTLKNSMRCAKKRFFRILATEISGMTMPEIYVLPGQFRLTILPKEHHGVSPGVCELDTQPSNWEILPLGYRRRSEIFVANS